MSKDEEQAILLKIVSQLEKVNAEVACWRAIFEQASTLIQKTDDHEKRLKSVENSRIPMAAGAAVIGGIFSHFIRLLF
jgi:hypothetical protein